MAVIKDGVDDDLDTCAYPEAEKRCLAPSDLVGQALQCVAEQGPMPVTPMLLAEEDEALFATVRERIGAPRRVKVSLDHL